MNARYESTESDTGWCVQFIEGRKGDAIAFIDGKIAFLSRQWTNRQPQVGETWLVKISGENARQTVYFLSPAERAPLVQVDIITDLYIHFVTRNVSDRIYFATAKDAKRIERQIAEEKERRATYTAQTHPDDIIFDALAQNGQTFAKASEIARREGLFSGPDV